MWWGLLMAEPKHKQAYRVTSVGRYKKHYLSLPTWRGYLGKKNGWPEEGTFNSRALSSTVYTEAETTFLTWSCPGSVDDLMLWEKANPKQKTTKPKKPKPPFRFSISVVPEFVHIRITCMHAFVERKCWCSSEPWTALLPVLICGHLFSHRRSVAPPNLVCAEKVMEPSR